jgi:vancomycin aglycone glucosyltransferase
VLDPVSLGAEPLARVAVPSVPVSRPLRPPVTGATPPTAADLPRRGTELIAAQVDTDRATAEGCPAPVVRGVMQERVWRWPSMRW